MKVDVKPPIPVFGIDSYDEAKAHYVDWLGFSVDWEWREADGQPVIMSISKGDATFMLNEYDTPTSGTVVLHVSDLDALAREWNDRKPGSVTVDVEPPYEFPAVMIADPWGTKLHFQQPDLSAEERARRTENRRKMQAYVRELRRAGKPFPTPEELRGHIGPDLGTAVEVLNEFEGYSTAYNERAQSQD